MLNQPADRPQFGETRRLGGRQYELISACTYGHPGQRRGEAFTIKARYRPNYESIRIVKSGDDYGVYGYGRKSNNFDAWDDDADERADNLIYRA